ncbi:hypothetical protein ALC62_07648, partial [Cyphomyrmex costatus]
IDKVEYCAVIKYFVLKGSTPTKIKSRLRFNFGRVFTLFSTVNKKEGFSHRESKHLNLVYFGNMSSTLVCVACQAMFCGDATISSTISGHFRNAIKINSGGLAGAENVVFEKVYRFSTYTERIVFLFTATLATEDTRAQFNIFFLRTLLLESIRCIV